MDQPQQSKLPFTVLDLIAIITVSVSLVLNMYVAARRNYLEPHRDKRIFVIIACLCFLLNQSYTLCQGLFLIDLVSEGLVYYYEIIDFCGSLVSSITNSGLILACVGYELPLWLSMMKKYNPNVQTRTSTSKFFNLMTKYGKVMVLVCMLLQAIGSFLSLIAIPRWRRCSLIVKFIFVAVGAIATIILIPMSRIIIIMINSIKGLQNRLLRIEAMKMVLANFAIVLSFATWIILLFPRLKDLEDNQYYQSIQQQASITRFDGKTIAYACLNIFVMMAISLTKSSTKTHKNGKSVSISKNDTTTDKSSFTLKNDKQSNTAATYKTDKIDASVSFVDRRIN